MTLRELALKYGTDKAGHHEYCEAYEFFLNPLRDKEFTLLEIGIGGYEFPDRGGESMRMWREYFQKAVIHAVDIYIKSFDAPGVTTWMGSQDDPVFLEFLFKSIDKPEVIIDDASHINELTLKTFDLCWPMLAPGGIYVVEDSHTSYWAENYGGGDHAGTVMNYFKRQADMLNSEHCRMPLDEKVDDIESIHFFKEIIFVKRHHPKGEAASKEQS